METVVVWLSSLILAAKMESLSRNYASDQQKSQS